MDDGAPVKYYYKRKQPTTRREFPLDLLYKVVNKDVIQYYCLNYRGDAIEKYKGKWLESTDHCSEYSLISHNAKSITEEEAFELMFTKP